MRTKINPDGFGFVPPSRHEADRLRKQKKNAKESAFSRHFPKGVTVYHPIDPNLEPVDPTIKEFLRAMPDHVRAEFHDAAWMMLAAKPSLGMFDECAWILFEAIVRELNLTPLRDPSSEARAWESAASISVNRRQEIALEIRSQIAASVAETEDFLSESYRNPSATSFAIFSKVALSRWWHMAYWSLRAEPHAKRLRTGGAQSKSTIDPFMLRMRKPLDTNVASLARALLRCRRAIEIAPAIGAGPTPTPSDMCDWISEWYDVSAATLKREFYRTNEQAKQAVAKERTLITQLEEHLRAKHKPRLQMTKRDLRREEARELKARLNLQCKIDAKREKGLSRDLRAEEIVRKFFFEAIII